MVGTGDYRFPGRPCCIAVTTSIGIKRNDVLVLSNGHQARNLRRGGDQSSVGRPWVDGDQPAGDHIDARSLERLIHPVVQEDCGAATCRVPDQHRAGEIDLACKWRGLVLIGRCGN